MDWTGNPLFKAECAAHAAYWNGSGPRPTHSTMPIPVKNTDYYLFWQAIGCLRYGWAAKGAVCLESVERRMKARPVLRVISAATQTEVPQTRDGKN